MKARFLAVLIAPIATALAASSTPGCGSEENVIDIYTCANRIDGRTDSQGVPDPCCRREPCPAPVDAGDAGEAGDADPGQAFCPANQCIPDPEPGWSEFPILLWHGLPAQEPACPDEVPTDGHWGADPTAPPLSCGLCECSTPAGTCRLPTKFTAYSAACNLPDGEWTSFDAPDSWDGGCTAENAIDAGAVCGQGVACVQSLTYDPLVIEQNDCEPSIATIPVTDTELTWGTSVLVCKKPATNYLPCEASELICAPTPQPPPPGFEVCVYQSGEHTCPDDYPVAYIFYKDVNDGRACAPCECGPPEGGACTATLSIFKDDVCSVPIPFVRGIDSDGTKCSDLSHGVALGSKQITDIWFEPGTCPVTGGEPVGQVEPAEPTTFCCLPPSPVAP